MALKSKDLLGIKGLSRDEITHILDTAATFKDVSERDIKKVPTLRGKTVINLFYEASTRTRTSFELAGKRLSADVINISTAASSVSKGETLLDTARNIEAMRADTTRGLEGLRGDMLAQRADLTKDMERLRLSVIVQVGGMFFVGMGLLFAAIKLV